MNPSIPRQQLIPIKLKPLSLSLLSSVVTVALSAYNKMSRKPSINVILSLVLLLLLIVENYVSSLISISCPLFLHQWAQDGNSISISYIFLWLNHANLADLFRPTSQRLPLLSPNQIQIAPFHRLDFYN